MLFGAVFLRALSQLKEEGEEDLRRSEEEEGRGDQAGATGGGERAPGPRRVFKDRELEVRAMYVYRYRQRGRWARLVAKACCSSPWLLCMPRACLLDIFRLSSLLSWVLLFSPLCFLTPFFEYMERARGFARLFTASTVFSAPLPFPALVFH